MQDFLFFIHFNFIFSDIALRKHSINSYIIFNIFFLKGYVVIVTEDLTNKSYRSEKYNGTRDLKLSQILGPLKRGGVYTVVIQRDVKGARNPRPSDPMKIYAGKSPY